MREGTALSNDVEQKAREQSCVHMPFLDASSGSSAAIYLVSSTFMHELNPRTYYVLYLHHSILFKLG
jgi:hypothetical protein